MGTLNNKEKGVVIETDGFKLSSDGSLYADRGFFIADTKHYEWKPKKDITTFELATCIPHVTGMQVTNSLVHNWKEAIEKLPDGCKRHFKVV